MHVPQQGYWPQGVDPNGVCPHCGRCPHCGQSTVRAWPYWNQPGPYEFRTQYANWQTNQQIGLAQSTLSESVQSQIATLNGCNH